MSESTVIRKLIAIYYNQLPATRTVKCSCFITPLTHENELISFPAGNFNHQFFILW